MATIIISGRGKQGVGMAQIWYTTQIVGNVNIKQKISKKNLFFIHNDIYIIIE